MDYIKRYKIDEFNDYCTLNGLIPPEDIMAKETELVLKGENYIYIHESIIKEMHRKKEEHDNWESDYKCISSLRLRGIEEEKLGNIEMAISSYQKCIEKGEQSVFSMFHTYAHAYERIIVLFHKTKQYNNEIQYINSLLKHDSLSASIINKYKERLNKINLKK